MWACTGLLRISLQAYHVFRFKLTTGFAARLPPVSVQAFHFFAIERNGCSGWPKWLVSFERNVLWRRRIASFTEVDPILWTAGQRG